MDKNIIYRTDAIDLLKKWADGYKYIETETELAIKEFEQLPFARFERPKGHWIFDFAHNEMTCSKCGRTFTGGFDLDNADNFCRHCGSDNRGEQDETD